MAQLITQDPAGLLYQQLDRALGLVVSIHHSLSAILGETSINGASHLTAMEFARANRDFWSNRAARIGDACPDAVDRPTIAAPREDMP